MDPKVDRWYLLDDENNIKRIIKITFREEGTDYFEANVFFEDGRELHNVPLTPKSFNDHFIRELSLEEVFAFMQ